MRASYSFFIPTKLINLTKSCRSSDATSEDCPQAIGFQFKAGTILGELPPYEAFCMGGTSSVRGWGSCDLAVSKSFVEGTVEYLSHQINAGAEVIKIFDSWAGSLKGNDFDKYALEPCKKIISALKVKHPNIPIIAFPRQAGDRYVGFAKQAGADCVALDESVSAEWISQNIQVDGCVQGNLASSHMVSGGSALIEETKRIVKALSNGPYIFNLGHGITPDADPKNVQIMIDTIRNAE